MTYNSLFYTQNGCKICTKCGSLCFFKDGDFCFAKSKLQRLPNFLYQAPRESLLKVMLSNIFLRALSLVQCLWWSPNRWRTFPKKEPARWQLIIKCFYVQNHSHFPSSRCGYLIPDMGLKDESVKRKKASLPPLPNSLLNPQVTRLVVSSNL